jgi:hypothetical protein
MFRLRKTEISRNRLAALSSSNTALSTLRTKSLSRKLGM